MDINKQIALERAFVIKHLLPDRCKIYPRTSGRVISGGISTSSAPVNPRLWHNQEEVPCRLDLSRAFRPDKLKTQATEVDEFNLELPFDLEFEPSDYVVVTHKGVDHRFEIRKIKDLSEWDVTVECVIDQTGTEIDYP